MQPTLACALTDWRGVLTDNPVSRDILTDALVSTDAPVLTDVPAPRAGDRLKLGPTLSRFLTMPFLSLQSIPRNQAERGSTWTDHNPGNGMG